MTKKKDDNINSTIVVKLKGYKKTMKRIKKLRKELEKTCILFERLESYN